MLHRRAIATDMGFNFNADTKLVATGGASINRSILQVIADVFNAPVYVQVCSSHADLIVSYFICINVLWVYNIFYMIYLEWQ